VAARVAANQVVARGHVKLPDAFTVGEKAKVNAERRSRGVRFLGGCRRLSEFHWPGTAQKQGRVRSGDG